MMSRLIIFYFFTSIFLTGTTCAVELSSIDQGDRYYFVNSSNKDNWKIVLVIEIDKENNIVKVVGQDKKILWVSPDSLSIAEDDSVSFTGGGSLITAILDAIVYSSIDEAVRNMEKANIAFNIPEKMNIDDVKSIRLLLSYKDTLEQLEKELEQLGRGFSESVRVSSKMEAKLSGVNFSTTNIAPEIQAITKNQKTEWVWDVKPMKEGKHAIHLTLTAFVAVKGEQLPRMIKTFERNILVDVTIAQKTENFIMKSWQWLWAAIFVPICGWLWSRKKLSRVAAPPHGEEAP